MGPDMEIFKEDIVFTKWGEIYTGLKHGLIVTEDVIAFGGNGKIKNCTEDQLVRLCLAEDKSIYSFFTIIKQFMNEEGEVEIIKNEDELDEYPWAYIPRQYNDIWALERLLRVKNSTAVLNKKAEYIYSVFDEVYYYSEMMYSLTQYLVFPGDEMEESMYLEFLDKLGRIVDDYKKTNSI